MLKWLFGRKNKPKENYEDSGKYYVVLVDGKPERAARIFTNLNKAFKRPTRKGDCFFYDRFRNRNPAHCTVMAICDSAEEARSVARHLYI